MQSHTVTCPCPSRFVDAQLHLSDENENELRCQTRSMDFSLKLQIIVLLQPLWETSGGGEKNCVPHY